MESKTTSKKQIVDFLWDWAGNSDWAKLLVKKVVNEESSLSSEDKEEVFNYFLQSIRLKKDLPALNFSKPTYSPITKTIEISALSKITGVNKLAKDQTIQFAPNLTVIYGENGTGKTGYGRILKTLGFSYDQNNNILQNIFGETEPQSAKIDYKANGIDNTFTWNGENRNDDLASISVFNNNCVQISLDAKRRLIVSPIGFHLFNLVSSELTALGNLLQEKKKEFSTEISWVENLHEDTPQKQFIDTLSKSSKESKLLELSNFGTKQENELSTKEKELSNLNKSLLQNEIRSLNLQITELNSLYEKIDQTKKTLNADIWNQLIEINRSIAELEKNTQKGISEIAASKGIEFYKTNEFKNFLSSAESYIKKINKPEYPQNGDVCIYCRQPLANDAKELLENYRRLLNDKSEENLARLKKSKQYLIDQISSIDTSIKLSYPSFGLDEKENPVQPDEFKNYNHALGLLKKAFINDEVTGDSAFDFKYDEFKDFINNKKEQLKSIIENKIESFKNIETKEKELKKEIAELKDRKYLSAKVDEIRKVIINHKILSVLSSFSNSFSTNSISRKTSQAREELVSQNFNDIFQEELKALRKSGLPIDLSFGTDRGATRLSHKISNHQLLEILSEGEQKAIALAEFLTELQLDVIKAPVIFDDPVNSLDHKIIDAVAKRLMRLSQVRQVVIFTHSVLLFNSLLYLKSQSNFKQLNNRFYNTRNEYNETGYISDAEEEINSVRQRITNINKYIQSAKERPELEVVKDCYDELRSAIELCVEHEIFKGTVKRYQKNISLTNFLKIDSTKIGTHQEALNDIFDRCCGFIGAHSNPEYVCNSPSLTGFTADFEDFKKIRKEFV